MDRLSALPDHIIHRIFSSFELKDVIGTSVLSTRWRYLWTTVPNLDLGTWEQFETETDIPTSITLSLMQYDSPKIRRFRAYFDFEDVTDHHVNAWVKFATKRNVEEFELCLCDREAYEDDVMESNSRYKVLGCLLSCKSLEVLRLTFCELNMRSGLNLCLLKELELQHVWLSDLDTSGCPVLESLHLLDCNTGRHLNICAPSQKLRCLTIRDFTDERSFDSSLTIFAPSVQYLQIDGFIRPTYNIKNLQSLRWASFDFYLMEEFGGRKSLVQLLQCVNRASTLKLCKWCIQVSCIYEAERVKLPALRAARLELETNLCKPELKGIAYLLGSAQNLKHLVLDISAGIRISEEGWRYLSEWYSSDCWESWGYSLSNIRHLKIIEINNFLQSKSHLLRKKPKPNLNIDKFLKNWKHEIKFVESIVSNCMMLQKMTVHTIQMRSWPLKSEFLLCLTERLLAVRKASANAEICILESNHSVES